MVLKRNLRKHHSCFFPAHKISRGYLRGRYDPEKVVEDHLARIGELDGCLHAYTEIYADEARAAAALSSQRHEEGRSLGPLDGIPIAVKDLFEIEGKEWGAGSATCAGRISARTASLVQHLEENGAIILGKTQTAEFAFGGWGTNAHLGTPRNPWFPHVPHTPGGSSSGSAVAVAGRLATLAIGTDTGGSVRIPAAFNGLVGLMITPGLLKADGIAPLSPSLDTVGPLCRTVTDAEMIFDLLMGEKHSPSLSRCDLDPDLKGLRLAAVGPEELEGVDSDIAQAYENSLVSLRMTGARIAVINLPRSLAAYQRNSEIMMAEAYAIYGSIAEDSGATMDPAVRARVLAGAMSARSYITARERARQDTNSMRQALVGYDALLTPTTSTLPIPLHNVDEATSPSVFTRFVNQIGFCALAVPNGLSRTGVPTSLQIVCRPFDEKLALRIGQACELVEPLEGAFPGLA